MGTSEVGHTIDAILKVGLAPSLKARGFTRDKRTWRRAHGDAIQVVNVQASQWNAGPEGRFTINLGLYFPSIAKLLGERAVEKPKEYECHLRQRIGTVVSKRDHWWTIDPNADANDLAVDTAEKLEKHGLPWLEARRTLADASRALDGAQAVWTPLALAVAAGDAKTARARYAAAKKDLRPEATVALRALDRLLAKLA